MLYDAVMKMSWKSVRFNTFLKDFMHIGFHGFFKRVFVAHAIEKKQ